MVSDEEALRWCTYNGLDGIITDDLEKSYDVYEWWDAGDQNVSIQGSTLLIAARVLFISSVHGFFFWRKHGDGFTRQRMSSERTGKASSHPARVALGNISMKPK